MTSRAARRHAIERAAVRSHLQLVASTRLPLYYVFDSLDALTEGHLSCTSETATCRVSTRSVWRICRMVVAPPPSRSSLPRAASRA